MGILPLQFADGDGYESLGLNGSETFSISVDGDLAVNQPVKVVSSTGVEFTTKSRLDTEPEIAYYKNGGILNFVLRNLVK